MRGLGPFAFVALAALLLLGATTAYELEVSQFWRKQLKLTAPAFNGTVTINGSLILNGVDVGAALSGVGSTNYAYLDDGGSGTLFYLEEGAATTELLLETL